jgi:hypothetical protein
VRRCRSARTRGEPISEIESSYLAWILVVFAPEFGDDDHGLFDAIEEELAERGWERQEASGREFFEKRLPAGKVARLP